MAPKRFVIIVNKQWECDPVLVAMGEAKACPLRFSFIKPIGGPLDPAHDKSRPAPRCVIDLRTATAEVWCLEDWLPAGQGSSSKAKMDVLPTLFAWSSDGANSEARAPALVVAVGTAGAPGAVSMNGSVVVGCRTFIHDAYPGGTNPQSPWEDPRCGHPLESAFKFGEFALKADLQSARFQAEARFVVPPMYPARRQVLLCAGNYTAVGVANVTNYDDYAWADGEALRAFEAADAKNPVGSVETTHGLIRLQSGAPFLFVSAITDREGRFNVEVGCRSYAQNFACAHNAGVCLAWLLPLFAGYLEF